MADNIDIGSLVVRLQAENKSMLAALKKTEDALNAVAGTANKSNAEAAKATKDTNDKITKSASDTEKKVKSSTKGMTKAFKQMSVISGGFIQAQLMMRLAALPGALATSMKEATLAFDKIDRRLRFVMKSGEGAAKAFSDLREVSAKYGTDLNASAQFYSSFLAATEATNISLAQSEALFLGTTQAAVALQMSTDQTKASFRAFQQMASKGRVAAEELRGQLGEALPGALGIAARAMDMPIEQLSKIMEKGELLAEDLLPAMGVELQRVFGGSALDASETYLAQLNRVDNQWFLLMSRMGKAAESTLIPALKSINKFLEGANFYMASMQLDPKVIGSYEALTMAVERYQDKAATTGTSGISGGYYGAVSAAALQKDTKAFEEIARVVKDMGYESASIIRNNLERIRESGELTKNQALMLNALNDKQFVHMSNTDRKMRDILAKGSAMTAQEKEKLIRAAEYLNVYQEIAAKLTEIEDHQDQIDSFNSKVKNTPAELIAKIEEEAAFRAMSNKEKILDIQEKIKVVASKINETQTEEFTQLRANGEEYEIQRIELERLLKLRQKIIEDEANQKPKDIFISPELDTKALDRRLYGPQNEIQKLQEEWAEIEREHAAHVNRINKSEILSEKGKEEELAKIRAQVVEAEKKFQLAQTQAVLSTSSTMFNDLATIAEGFAGKQTGVYKALFAMSKAFAIADIAIRLPMAIAQAISDPLAVTLPQKLANWAIVASMGASLMSQVTSATASFEGGGYTGSGDRVGGVDGRGGFNAILHPNEVVTDLTKGRSSPGWTINIQNNAQAEVTPQVDETNKTISIMIDRIINKDLPASIGSGGNKFSKTMERTYGLTRG